MTTSKKISSSAQERFFKFFDGSISPIQFEKWLFENSEVESCLGVEKYHELLSLNFRSNDSISNVERLVEGDLEFDKYYGRKLLVILESLLKVSWTSSDQLKILLEVMDELEQTYSNGPESLQDILEDVLDREGAYLGWASRAKSLSVDEEKRVLLAFRKTVDASQRAIVRVKKLIRM